MTYSRILLSKAAIPVLLAAFFACIGPQLAHAGSVTDAGATGNGSTDDTGAIQAAASACSGGTVTFPAGTYRVTGLINLQPNCTYQGTGNPVILGYQGTGGGGYYVFNVDGSGITISGITFDGGGILITTAADRLKITGNIIRNILNSGGWFSGIFQQVGTGHQITNSSIDHNQVQNIYAPGQLTCDGQYPLVNGVYQQPCDWYRDGMDFYSLANTTITNNTFDTIAGDEIHIFNDVSCADYYGTGPAAEQPNISIANNTFANGHRIPLEVQLCHTTNFLIESNLVVSNYLPNAWDIAISFASDGTGDQILGNFVSLNGNNSPGGPGGVCYEVGGVGTVVSGNTCQEGSGPSGKYYQLGAVVMQSSQSFTNNLWCGPNATDHAQVEFEPPCINPGVTCVHWTEGGNTSAGSCTTSPGPTVGSGGVFRSGGTGGGAPACTVATDAAGFSVGDNVIPKQTANVYSTAGTSGTVLSVLTAPASGVMINASTVDGAGVVWLHVSTLNGTGFVQESQFAAPTPISGACPAGTSPSAGSGGSTTTIPPPPPVPISILPPTLVPPSPPTLIPPPVVVGVNIPGPSGCDLGLCPTGSANSSGTDTAPPIVFLSSPPYGQTVSGSIVIQAQAADDTGIAGVQFQIDGKSFAQTLSAPYQATWDTTKVPDGIYLLTALASDLSNNKAITSPAFIIVQNGSASAPSPTPAPAPAPAPGTPPPAPSPAPSPSSPGTFSSGQSIVVKGTVNVRSSGSLSGTVLGTESDASRGTVSGGPATADGYTWIKVDFADGKSGWVATSFVSGAS